MGIRLYPITRNIEKIETLANVPVGTHKQLETLRAEYDLDNPKLSFHEREKLYEEFYNAKNLDPDLDQLDSFLLFGWGKFLSHGLKLDEYGSTTNIETIKDIFVMNGIYADPYLTEGLYWG